MNEFDRRAFCKLGLAATLMSPLPRLARAQSVAAKPIFKPQLGEWRTFELTTTVVLPQADATRLWLPIPQLDNGFQRTLSTNWAGNSTSARALTAGGAQMLFAEFSAKEQAPTLTLISRVQTRNRAVDWLQQSGGSQTDSAMLGEFLQATRFLPTDGIVRETALAATRGAATDFEKVRALYKWVVTNCHREPSVRGCGTGDVATLLKNDNLGGKCADLNALFVAMARAVGIPARDIYGIRVAPSSFDYRELGANPAQLAGAQHCRAEVWLKPYGWVAMDPADVLKVMRQEKSEWIKDLNDPLIQPVDAALFGSWEGNWIGYNMAHDIRLPQSSIKTSLPFLMYPQAENSAGRLDELAPDKFRYTINAREISI